MALNCEFCGKFVPEDLEYNGLCRKCNPIMIAEVEEAELGIGNGQYYYPDQNFCRHGIEK